MGVPKFYSWLRAKNQTFRGILQKSVPSIVSSLSIDMNGLLHTTAQIVFAYGKGENEARKIEIEESSEEKLYAEYFAALSTSLFNILTSVAPRDFLILAVDGVAPQAKINAQRARRFTSSSSGVFNSNVISPGTEFMFRVDEYIKFWISSNSATLPAKVIYSSHMVPGEAEHKILYYYRGLVLQGAHCIYGLDADLVVLSLGLEENMIVMREDIRDIVNITNLKDYITQTLRTATAISDFMVLSFFLGNDFLPNTPAFEDLVSALDNLMDIYRRVNQSIVVNGEIDYSVIIKILARIDEKLLLAKDIMHTSEVPQAIRRTLGYTTTISQGQVKTFPKLDMTLYEKFWYEEALGSKEYSDVAEKILGRKAFPETSERKKKMVTSYLVGLSWIWKYYTGRDFNISWFYPYHHAPLLETFKGLTKIDTTPSSQNANILSTTFLNVPQQLVSILPLSSKSIMPKPMQPLTKTYLADDFPIKAIIKQKANGADWHKVILLPFLDEERVVFTTPAFTKEEREKYAPQNEIVITRETYQTYPEEKSKLTMRKPTRNIVPRTSYPSSAKNWRKKKPLT